MINQIFLGLKMKLTIQALLMTIIILFMVACVQVPQESLNSKQVAISSVRDLPTSFPQGSHFFLAPKYLKQSSLNALQTQSAYQPYANAIIVDLQDHGFIQASNVAQSDFLVGFGVALAEDLTDDMITEKFGVTPGLRNKENLKKGSFLIYIADAKTRQKIWRGTVQGFVQDEFNDKQRGDRAKNVIKLVLKQFYTNN